MCFVFMCFLYLFIIMVIAAFAFTLSKLRTFLLYFTLLYFWFALPLLYLFFLPAKKEGGSVTALA